MPADGSDYKSAENRRYFKVDGENHDGHGHTEYPRHYQVLAGRDAEGLDAFDLVVYFHVTEFRGNCRAASGNDDNGGQQGPQFPDNDPDQDFAGKDFVAGAHQAYDLSDDDNADGERYYKDYLERLKTGKVDLLHENRENGATAVTHCCRNIYAGLKDDFNQIRQVQDTMDYPAPECCYHWVSPTLKVIDGAVLEQFDLCNAELPQLSSDLGVILGFRVGDQYAWRQLLYFFQFFGKE